MNGQFSNAPRDPQRLTRAVLAPDIARVREAYNALRSSLKLRCQQPIEELLGTDAPFSYIDNGAQILAVAHCDGAAQIPVGWYAEGDCPGYGPIVHSPWLDDRLGVFTILDLLPALGVKVDVLLTDGEERAQSTAAQFVLPPGKQYNWAVEFDRRGEDAVCYHYDNMEDFAEPYFEIGRGTFSDISVLNAGCQAINIGVGYHEEHTVGCYCILEEYFEQVARFLVMYRDKSTVRVPAKPAPVRQGYWPSGPAANGYCKPNPDDVWEVGTSRGEDARDDTFPYDYYEEAIRQGICPQCDELLTPVSGDVKHCRVCDIRYKLSGWKNKWSRDAKGPMVQLKDMRR
ncbi:MAG: hypothetical protein FJ279_03590 [Planctomycetes bacterium]|nr:hypothetical protein [Planctomycetota bacterium]